MTGPYYAVTSISGASGTWQILSDGPDPASVYDRAVLSLTGGQAGVTLANLPIALAPIQSQMAHLQILTRPQAIARVGRNVMEQYEAP